MRHVKFFLPVLLPTALLLATACGGTSTTTDAGPPDGGATSCPADPPTGGASCSGSAGCLWERCPADQVYTASCNGGSWSVTTTACGMHSCDGRMDCGAEEICVARAGGALQIECAAHPGGDGPIAEACACGLCAGFPCQVTGRGVTCNTCPGPQPCP